MLLRLFIVIKKKFLNYTFAFCYILFEFRNAFLKRGDVLEVININGKIILKYILKN
jgi:hypothetical protein